MLGLGLGGCVGKIGETSRHEVGGVGDTPRGGGTDPQVASEIGVSGLRRLSVMEYQRTIFDLLGVEVPTSAELLPQDALTPFDNDFTLQAASEPLIKGVELLAGDLADKVSSSPDLRSKLVDCAPASATDESCFRSFIVKLGRRVMRRPLSETEVTRFVALQQHAVAAGDFWVGVAAVLRAFLQHPEFLYRVEIGTPVAGQPGLSQLNDFEVGARLSYFLLGTTPPDWLLDAADAKKLTSKSDVAAAVTQLLSDDRARPRINRFHSMWLGYDKLNRDGLFGQMHDETNALLARVIFEEKRPWMDVLMSDETFLTPELATHYGLPSPGAQPGWVKYAGSGRLGLLSQGTFLSAVAKFGDSSPTQRGRLVRTRLFCQTIPPPPATLKVDINEPPKTADPNACKHERYYMSREPMCAGCHGLMDPIGFGLENYDPTGSYRTTEPNRPECPIDGKGDFTGLGSFNGPGELAKLAMASGQVESCVATQLYRFAVGRTDLDDHDDTILTRLATEASAGGGLQLREFILGYVSSDAFLFRREEASP
jgi:Protein of unknown function (DUF1588)/Protein of unknown function (DUF1592)/Protein of unknown function (DUF1595)/Protein of unknown function (DUF1585)/Protein of unknown function (DUF1587)